MELGYQHVQLPTDLFLKILRNVCMGVSVCVCLRKIIMWRTSPYLDAPPIHLVGSVGLHRLHTSPYTQSQLASENAPSDM